MHHTHWSTRRVNACDRAQVWSNINARYFGRLRVASLHDGPLDASLDAFNVGPLRMYRIDAPAHRIERDEACGALPTDDFYKLVLQVSGRGIVEQQQRRVVLQPGHWILYDPRAPYLISNAERCTLLVTQVPRSLLGGLHLSEPHAVQIGSDNKAGLHGVLGSYLRALSDQLPGLPDRAGQAVSTSLRGLLGSTLSDALTCAGDPVPLPSMLRMRACQYVQAHLSEPDLSIQGIADALRCSKRYLRRVFESDEVSLERHIWNSRLERCHAALVHETSACRSAAEIGFAWGFGSSAHFGRLFKQRYGVTPGACQRRAAQERAETVTQ